MLVFVTTSVLLTLLLGERHASITQGARVGPPTDGLYSESALPRAVAKCCPVIGVALIALALTAPILWHLLP